MFPDRAAGASLDTCSSSPGECWRPPLALRDEKSPMRCLHALGPENYTYSLALELHSKKDKKRNQPAKRTPPRVIYAWGGKKSPVRGRAFASGGRGESWVWKPWLYMMFAVQD